MPRKIPTHSSEPRGLPPDPASKLTLAVDFHGVLCSYTSGYQGPGAADDAPNPGAIEWLGRAAEIFHVAILSGRFSIKTPEGTSTMRGVRDWLRRYGLKARVTEDPDRSGPIYLTSIKPRCHLLIDDRVHLFAGTFPDPADLVDFRPWNW